MPTKKISYFISVLPIFLVLVTPLIVSNSFFFPFITGKAFLFRILIEIAFASWIVLASIDIKYRPKLNPITIGVTIFTLVTLLADLLGVNPLRSLWSNFERMEGWVTIIHLWAFFIVITSIFGADENSKKIWSRFLNTSIFVAFIVAMYGLTQLFGWTNIHQGSIRIDASLGNAAYMAVYMMIHAFLSAYMFFVNRNGYKEQRANIKYKIKSWIYGITSLLFGYLVFETQTRGTILGLVGGIILTLVLYSIFERGRGKKSRLIAVGTLVFIILVSLSFWMNRESQFVRDNEILNRIATISIHDFKTQARGYVWPMVIEGALERPIFGWGQENFNYVFNANYNPKMWMHEQWFDRAHNVFLDWLIAGGFVGLLSYLTLYVLFLLAVWKSRLTIVEKSILTGLIFGYAIHNVFVFDNLTSYILFFSMIGFVSSFYEGNSIKLFNTRSLSSDAVLYVVTPIMLVALVFTGYFVNFRLMVANTRLITALTGCSGKSMPDPTLFTKALNIDSYTANQEIREQLLSCANVVVQASQIPGTLKQEFFQLASNEIEAQKKITPKDARIYILGGMFMNNAGQYKNARLLMEEAVRLTPTKQSAIVLLAQIYINSGKYNDAVEILRKAYESASDNNDVKLMYVTVLVASGKESEAKEIFKDDLSIFESSSVAQAYAINKNYIKSIEIYRALIKANPDDINNRVQLAQIQYSAGLKYDAIATLRKLADDKPELKAQIEGAIKQIQ